MITVVIGAQYGGEGKGKITAVVEKKEKIDVVCRTGGVNSKHTVIEKGKQYDLRQLPTPCVGNFKGKVCFGAGALVHIKTLNEEIKLLNFPKNKILIDQQTGILTEKCIKEQRKDGRYKKIGSTLTGTGYATSQRALRKLPLAKEFKELDKMNTSVSKFLWKELQKNKNILIEGHQSTGLSNFHGDYPYVSNRDSTVAEIFSELGLGIRYKTRIILTVKIFPTRNHNGSLPGELSVQEADRLGITEYGGGSWGIENNRRRVGKLNIKDILHSIRINTPTEIALTGVDYFEPADFGCTSYKKLSQKTKKLIENIEKKTNLPVKIISTGPKTEDVVIKN